MLGRQRRGGSRQPAQGSPQEEVREEWDREDLALDCSEEVGTHSALWGDKEISSEAGQLC